MVYRSIYHLGLSSFNYTRIGEKRNNYDGNMDLDGCQIQIINAIQDKSLPVFKLSVLCHVIVGIFGVNCGWIM